MEWATPYCKWNHVQTMFMRETFAKPWDSKSPYSRSFKSYLDLILSSKSFTSRNLPKTWLRYSMKWSADIYFRHILRFPFVVGNSRALVLLSISLDLSTWCRLGQACGKKKKPAGHPLPNVRGWKVKYYEMKWLKITSHILYMICIHNIYIYIYVWNIVYVYRFSFIYKHSI